MKLKVLITFLFLFAARISMAQPSTDQQLAVHYYQNGEFDKALMYFEKLYEKSSTTFYYSYYFKCLVELKNYKEAEKLVKKHQKKEPRNLTLYLDLADLYLIEKEESKAKQQYELAIKSINPDRGQIIQLAEAFRDRNLIDYALLTYEKGAKLLDNSLGFTTEQATLYAQKGDYAKMTEKLFELLAQDPLSLSIVQQTLTQIINFEEGGAKVEMLKSEILRKIQKYPDNEAYNEMLIWFFQQKGDFNSAFTQVKALDKRMKLDGMKVNKFAEICLNNEQLEAAARSYEYIVALGPDKPYYYIGKTGLYEVLYKKVVDKGFYTPEELLTLEANCVQMLEEFGKSAESYNFIKSLAHIRAFYLHKNLEAIKDLDDALQMPGLGMQQEAELKMELADILVLDGNVWDASLYYSQVEKAFKHDVLGHEAKFRNARVFYYSGDYLWAQSQLDVLKASTSKLIANDAMQLSLLITDNLGMDSLPEALDLYSSAELLTYQNKHDEALKTLDTLSGKFPFHSLADESLFLRAKISKKRGNYDEAVKFLEEIVTKFPQDILGDDAVFSLAEMYLYHYKNNDKAAEYYKKILFEYPGSLYQVEARKQFRTLRGEKIN